MALDTKPNLSDSKFEQRPGEILHLSGSTHVHDYGEFRFQSGSTFVIEDSPGVNKVLVSNATGCGSWSNIPAYNGLSVCNLGRVALGGSLSGDTEIEICSYKFQVSGIENLFALTGDSAMVYASGATLYLKDGCASLSSDVGDCLFMSPVATTFTSASGGGIKYADNYSSNYTIRSLVDKGYVTGLTANIITGATNGIGTTGRRVCLGGALGTTTLSLTTPIATFMVCYTGNSAILINGGGVILCDCNSSLLLNGDVFLGSCSYDYLCMGNTGTVFTIGTGGGVKYANDYSSTYTLRSLVDKAYVTGLTSSFVSSSGERVTKLINKTSHGFAVQDVIGWSGGTYNKAIADGTYDGEVIGIVSRCYNANCFDLTQAGYVTGLTGLVLNTTYFLSDATAGLLTATEPTAENHISRAVLVANSTTTGWVLPYVGYIITSGTTPSVAWGDISGSIADQTDLQTVLLKSVTGATNLGAGNGALYTSVSDQLIQLKRLSGGTNITITSGDSYVVINSTSVSAVWGNITGTLSDQTDLQSALDGKSPTGHTHSIYALQSSLTTYTGTTAPTTYALKSLAITGATNLGSGNGTIYTNTTNNKLNLKTLSGGTNVTITCNANYIAISANDASGIEWNGTTANGIGTYVDANTICSQPNLTFNGTRLSVTGNVCASTCVTSPILSGTTCVRSPIVCGSTCVASPVFIENGVSLASKYSLTGHTHNQYALQSSVVTYTGTTAPATYVSKTVYQTYTGTTAPATYLPFTMATDMQDPTGFVDGSNINISYNYTNRTITLTGDLSYYWKGVKRSLTNPWTSSAHTATIGRWFLYSTDGLNFTWSQSVWDFNYIMVSGIYYQATEATSLAIRETHGLLDWQAHETLHNTIGTYLKSGGQATSGSYTANTATNAGITPSFNAASLDDEDLTSTIASWPKTSGYTVMRISAGTSVYTFSNTAPFLAAGDNTYIYVNDPVTGSLTAGVANRYYNAYQILVPTTSDSNSQKYRMIFLPPQATYTTLTGAQAEDTRGLRLGSLTTASAEYVIYARITYSTSNSYSNYGKVVIPTDGITYVVGSKFSALSVAGVSTTNHANLSNLTWSDSGHLGNNDTLAAFNASGVAEYVSKLYYSASGHTHSIYVPLSAYQTYTGTTAPATYALKSLAITGATNLGTGNGTIYTNVTNNKLNLKTLSGGTNITITCDANYIAINSTASGSVIGGTNGLYLSGNKVALGGVLTGNTTIYHNGNNLHIKRNAGDCGPYICLTPGDGTYEAGSYHPTGEQRLGYYQAQYNYTSMGVADIEDSPSKGVSYNTYNLGNPFAITCVCSGTNKTCIVQYANCVYLFANACMLVSGNTGFNGIEYCKDYSANYSNRSLVDKEYVDNAGGSGVGIYMISGNSSATGFSVTHGCNQQFVMVQIVQADIPYATVYTDVRRTNANCVCIMFDTAPTTGTNYKILIAG
jgi:hypothetical protein